MPPNEIKLAANQKFRETWIITENNRKIIEKRISKDCGQEALKRIEKTLDKQIDLSKKLTKDELKHIILFYEREERDTEIVYHRPYIEGETLASKINTSRMKTLDAIELILKIGKIVSHANKKGIVHGDLKPENIIISRDSSICIIDWDTMQINRNINDAQRVTMTQEESAGTPEYMDPEQCIGKSANQQSDVYALGLILYAMLAGKTPYTEMKALEILDQKHFDIENISSQYPDLQIDFLLASVIEDALKKERNYRIKTVSEFLERLKAVNGEDTAVLPNHFISLRDEKTSRVPLDNVQNKTPKYNFVLIGHSGSGKTVLAAGLYSYSSDSFSVEADTQTRKNADNLKARLITHQWPDHTARGGSTDFTFFIYKKQDDIASITFSEYAGEDINLPTYCDDYLKDSSAVVLLLNPNIMEKDNHEIIDRMSKLKECITYLSKRPVVPPVAFLVTASDRLETDFSGRKDEFEKYANEIMISLNAKKIPSQRFDVSVTGKLESQDRANLNPINIDKPFIWLLDYLSQKEKKRKLRNLLKYCIPIAMLFFICIVLSAFNGCNHRSTTDSISLSPRTDNGEIGGTVHVENKSSQDQIETESFQKNFDKCKFANPSEIKLIVAQYDKLSAEDKSIFKQKMEEKINSFINSQFNGIDTNADWKDMSKSLKNIKLEDLLQNIAPSFPQISNNFNDQKKKIQKSIFESCKSKIQSKSNFEDKIREMETFKCDESSNPYIKEWESWFFREVLYNEYKKLFNDPHQPEKDFLSLSETCNSIKRISWEGDIGKEWKEWCEKYITWKKKNSQYTINFEKLQAKVKYPNPDDPYFKLISIKYNDNEIFPPRRLLLLKKMLGQLTTFEETYKTEKYKDFDEKLPSPSPTSIKLGEYIHFTAEIYDQAGLDKLKESFDEKFYPGIDDPKILEIKGNYSDVLLTLSGIPDEPFMLWIEDHPLPNNKR